MKQKQTKQPKQRQYSAEFRDAVKSVNEISLPFIDKRARKIKLALIAQAKGKKVNFNEKESYPHLMRKRKQQAAKIDKLKKLEQELNVNLITSKALDYNEIARNKKNANKRATKKNTALF